MTARVRSTLLLIALVAAAFGVQANHIVGGDMSYTYLGETSPGSGLYRYSIRVRMYLKEGQGITSYLAPETGPAPVGIYELDTIGADQLVLWGACSTYYSLDNVDTLGADLPPGCVLGNSLSVEQSLLFGEFVVPYNASGYHLFFDGSARNGGIDNILEPTSTGLGWYAYVPPANIVNSSPYFLGNPVPYLCVGDTLGFPYATEEADGDVLVYSFRDPIDQQNGNLSIFAQPEAATPWPLGTVPYVPGHSAAQPFGPGGYASINSSSGTTEFYVPAVGNWVLAVQVEEYRNGELIGLIRSDLQLVSTACEPNDLPLFEPPQDTALAADSVVYLNNGSLQLLTYSVDAGQALCFPILFRDVDTITMAVDGSIFSADPPAQISGALTADSLLSVEFCWPTSCAQGQSAPYSFNVSVTDQACPPGIVNFVVQVTVIPYANDAEVLGPTDVCAGQTVASYCAETVPGATYQWQAEGGTILDQDTGTCATVKWEAEGPGRVMLLRNTPCPSQDTLVITGNTAPEASFRVTDTILSCEEVSFLVENTSVGASGYVWLGPGGARDSAETIPLIVGYQDSARFDLVAISPVGCLDTAGLVLGAGAYDALVQYYLPNVFSPNSDSRNDRLGLVSNGPLAPCTELSIWDRWGKTMFTTTDEKRAWTGLAPNGDRAPEGVYYYELRVRGKNYRGNVHLLR
jgi:gliding motility-associated-like protein